MNELLYVIVSALMGGAAGAFLYNVLHNWGINRRVVALEERLLMLDNRERGAKGNIAREKASEEEGAALAEAAGLLASGQLNQDSIAKLAMKYPNAAKSLLKRYT